MRGSLLYLIIIATASVAAGMPPRLVKDIRPGAPGSPIWKLAASSDRVFFDGAPGGWWTSDGTTAGTFELAFVGDVIDEVVTAGGIGYALTSHMVSDYQAWTDLWRSDGTVAGTYLLKHLGDACAPFARIHTVGDRLFFEVCSTTGAAGDLWVTDGTTAGTVEVRRNVISRQGAVWGELGGRLYFAGCDAVGCGLFASDGTLAGTLSLRYTAPPLVLYDQPGEFQRAADRLYFAMYSGPSLELWVTAGSGASTERVAVLGNGSISLPSRPVPGPLFWFAADDGLMGWELWRSDGSAAGTAPVLDLCPGSCSSLWSGFLGEVGGLALFAGSDLGNDSELWSTNGLPAGTRLVRDVLPGPGRGIPMPDSETFDGMVWFGGDNGTTGEELWRSSGASGGTYLVADINPGPAGSSPRRPTATADKLFFAANDGVHGQELWVLDAPSSTAAGLLRSTFVTSLDPVTPALSTLLPLHPIGDLYLTGFLPDSTEPDLALLRDSSRPLVFYSLDRPGTLRLARTGVDEIRFDF